MLISRMEEHHLAIEWRSILAARVKSERGMKTTEKKSDDGEDWKKRGLRFQQSTRGKEKEESEE
jgi:hypothetical protein